jgi:hypothetical protein
LPDVLKIKCFSHFQFSSKKVFSFFSVSRFWQGRSCKGKQTYFLFWPQLFDLCKCKPLWPLCVPILCVKLYGKRFWDVSDFRQLTCNSTVVLGWIILTFIYLNSECHFGVLFPCKKLTRIIIYRRKQLLDIVSSCS